MARIVWLTRGLVFLVVIAALAYWKGFGLLAAPLSLGGLIMMAYLLLSLVAVVGLLRRRSWGFHVLYALIVYATIALGVAFIPVRLPFLSPRARSIGLLTGNVIVLAVSVVGHRWLRALHNGTARGAA